MKKIVYIVIFAGILYSCGKSTDSIDEVIESGDIGKMRGKRTEVLASYDSIGRILTRLELAIAENDTTKKYPLVTIFKVEDTLFRNFISIQGNVETAQNILIYPEYQGVLSRVHVRQGQNVTKGQLMASIDDGGLSSQLAQLETQYELAKTTYERQQRLWDQKIGSEMQLLQARTNMEATESSVKQLRSQLGKTSIRAPFSGVVDEIITEQGQVVGPGGQPIMRVVNLSDMYVKASVPENFLESVTKGSMVTVTFPAINMTTEGKVTGVGNYINPSNRTFQIEVDVTNEKNNIRPNLVANLQINNYSKEDAITIPSNSIQENARGEKYVFVLTEREGDNAIVARKEIKTGKRQSGFVEVIEGLESGETIVKDGALSLADGSTITIQPEN